MKGHPELRYEYLSEEHRSFAVRDGHPATLAIGDVVEIHPGHGCSAANLHDLVFAVRNGVIEDVWLVTAHGQAQ